jgi:hypothetical protein
MSSFIRYVLKYKKSDCPYGDLARDILQDENIYRTWSYKIFKTYLQEHHNVNDTIITLVDELHVLHRQHQKNLYRDRKDQV